MSKRATSLEVACAAIADCRRELDGDHILGDRLFAAQKEVLAKVEQRIRQSLGAPRRRKAKEPSAVARNPRRGDGHDEDRALARREEATGVGP